MSINGINLKLDALKIKPRSIEPIAPDGAQGVKGAGESFGEMFSNAIKEVDTLQKQADNQIEGLVTGKDGVTSHGAMLALEKADIAFQLMSAIRSKIIRAYEEVIRTQV